MKKALLTMALLVVPFFSSANIYDNAQSVNAEDSTTCVTEPTISEYIAEQNSNRAPGSTTTPKKLKQSYAPVINGSSCNQPHTIEWKSWLENPDGTRYNERDNEQLVRLYGSVTTVPSCENLSVDQGVPFSQSHSHLGYDSSGMPQCYTTQALADADTCEEKDSDGLYESFISSESSVSCMEKPEDGSICPVKKNFEITSNSTGNTSYFYEYDTNSDPASCYKQNTVEPPQPTSLEMDNTFPSNVGECSESNGISMCNENPINVCDQNGNCQKGCGSIAFGGQQEFVCLSGDLDNDGIPDYQDRDKDGDGIKNEDDLDSDGDGIEDPIDNTSNNVRTPHQSTLEQLLGQIAQNTSGGTGGGGGSGASASQIGESVAEELEEKLVEQADFSGTEYEQSVNAKIEATDTAIDEFLEDNEKDLTNAFDETEFKSSFSTLKSTFAPKGCSAQFGIPFTNSTLDLCEPASKAQPFLYVIFAISTFIYCMRRIQSTARSE